MTIITTQRLIIRHFKEEMRQLFSITSLHHVLLALRMKSYIHSLRQRSTWLNEPLTQHSFAVCLKETDTLIGHLFADIATNQTTIPGQRLAF